MSSIRSRAPEASSELVRRAMQANVGRETTPEQMVRQFLRLQGFRFRTDDRPLPSLRCAADLVFRRIQLCIFIDGCFWHGCPKHFRQPAANSAWWAEKIGANRVRDRRNTRILRQAGWEVIRVWEHQLGKQMLRNLIESINTRQRRILHAPRRSVSV